MKTRCFIIAEAGINHNGSIKTAFDLIDVAINAGADAIKFQTFKAEELATPGSPKAEYQNYTRKNEDQLTMLKRLQLKENAYPKLIEYCQLKGIEFLSTPFDYHSARMLVEIGMKKIKVASGEITNLPFLEYLANFKLPIILSTGMASLEEIEEGINVIKSSWLKFDIQVNEYLTILHCTSNYPTKVEDVNLLAIASLRDKFNLPIGYSDHTLGTDISIAAVSIGAKILEKHFTLDCTSEGPDHKASLNPLDLTSMIRKIRMIELALGDGEKIPRQSELPIRDIVRRSVTLTKSVKAGEKITLEILSLMRPGDGIAPKHLNKVIGMKSIRDLEAWTTLKWNDISS